MSNTTVQDAPVGAARDWCSHIRLWLVAVLGLALDLWSKQWAFSRLDVDPTKSLDVIPGLLSFRRTLNDGALFGLGKGLWLVFVIASVLALGFVWYLFANSSRTRWSLHVGLGLILAGALGNLYDRAFVLADVVEGRSGREVCHIVREDEHFLYLAPWPDEAPISRVPKSGDLRVRKQGVVRDFIKIEPRFGIELWPWVFNVADVLLVAGVGLLLLNFWKERKTELAARQAAPVLARPAAPPPSGDAEPSHEHSVHSG